MQVLFRILIFLSVLFTSSEGLGARIKDISRIQGVRHNHLVGYGLVIGLNGSGDQTNQTTFTLQSFRNMLAQFGVAIPNSVRPQLRNVAAVVVTAELPAFSKSGQTLDIVVSSIGNASSLQGGTLLMTPLKAADGQVYALAQRSLVVSGFEASGRDGSSITVNVPSTARIPNGATVERAVFSPFQHSNAVILNLNHSDFTTATRMVDAINQVFGPQTATAIDATSVRVQTPSSLSEKVHFISAIEKIELNPGNAAAKIVINSRTGTIVIGQHVRVKAAAVSHGNLTVSINEQPTILQPEPFSEGDTALVTQSEVNLTQEQSRTFLLPQQASLQEIVEAVNRVGAAPGDLMAILEALKRVGALEAELVVL